MCVSEANFGLIVQDLSTLFFLKELLSLTCNSSGRLGWPKSHKNPSISFLLSLRHWAYVFMPPCLLGGLGDPTQLLMLVIQSFYWSSSFHHPPKSEPWGQCLEHIRVSPFLPGIALTISMVSEQSHCVSQWTINACCTLCPDQAYSSIPFSFLPNLSTFEYMASPLLQVQWDGS